LTEFRGHLILMEEGVRDGKDQAPVPAAFKQQIVELAMSGRTPAELSREFGVAAQSIVAWVARAAADAGKPMRGKDVLSTAEREELARLRRQVRQLQQERDILAMGTAWFAAKGGKTSTGSMNS
jgi:transposase